MDAILTHLEDTRDALEAEDIDNEYLCWDMIHMPEAYNSCKYTSHIDCKLTTLNSFLIMYRKISVYCEWYLILYSILYKSDSEPQLSTFV